MIRNRRTAGLFGIACAALFTSQSALGQASALMDDIRVELPAELTEPETRSVSGVFTVPSQGV